MSALIDLVGQKFGMLIVNEKHGSDRTGKTTWLCICECGNQSVTTGLNLKSGNTKSCGCLKKRKGAANPKFIDIDPAVLRERKRTYSAYRNWRESVINRHQVCIKCGTDSGLEVHHIEGAYQNPTKVIDPNNGVTLCRECHTKFHSTYGRKTGFSENDLEAFIAGPGAEIVWLVSRWRSKNGLEDLRKARHFLDLLIEHEESKQ